MRLGWIGSIHFEVCYISTERVAVLPLKLGTRELSCLRTQHGGKQHKVQKRVSDNRLCFCVLFKIHLLDSVTSED